MILAPIDGSQFARSCRRRQKSAASCQWPQLARLLTLVAVASVFVAIALGPTRSNAAPLAAASHAENI
jgi:hypothetical protein